MSTPQLHWSLGFLSVSDSLLWSNSHQISSFLCLLYRNEFHISRQCSVTCVTIQDTASTWRWQTLCLSSYHDSGGDMLIKIEKLSSDTPSKAYCISWILVAKPESIILLTWYFSNVRVDNTIIHHSLPFLVCLIRWAW